MSSDEYNRPLGIARVVSTFAMLALLFSMARPRTLALVCGLPLVALGEGLRIWAAGHLRKTVELITSGPYRYTRNPLYLGRITIFSGLCVMATLPYGANWILLAFGLAVFFSYYLPRKEAVEPARLRRTHGEAYDRYFRAVPALWPSRVPYAHARADPWLVRRLLRNREQWMVLALLAATAWLWFRRLP